MTNAVPVATPPVTVENPDAWNDLAAGIQQRTGLPPITDLNTISGFVATALTVLFTAVNTNAPDMLRGTFNDQVIAQLVNHPGLLAGNTPESVDLVVIGARPASGDPVVRLRVQVSVRNGQGQPTVLEQFWDVQMSGNTAVVGAEKCPNCGAALPNGALVCPYCNTDTRTTAQMPLLVVKLERMS